VCSVSTTIIRTFKGHTDEVNAVCWSPGGVFLASCSDDSTAKIWSLDALPSPSSFPEDNIEESGLIHNLQGHSKEIYTVRWTPTGPFSANPDKPLLLCTASFDGTVKAWSAITGSYCYLYIRVYLYIYLYICIYVHVHMCI
jgi:transducin (beta)-like 1